MGVWGRLRFARKPICVIGESDESRFHLPPKVKSSKSFVDRNTPQNTFWSTFDHSEVDTLILIFPICNLPTFRPRLKCQKASSGYFTEYLARTLFCWEKLYLSFGHILQGIFGEKGKVFRRVDKSLNISEKQKLIPDLLVVSASIVVLAFGSNGQVTSCKSILLSDNSTSLLGLCYISYSGNQISSSEWLPQRH